MSEQEIAIPLCGPGEGMYVLTVPSDMLDTAESIQAITEAWAGAKAGHRLLIVPEGVRLEWVGPPGVQPEAASE